MTIKRVLPLLLIGLCLLVPAASTAIAQTTTDQTTTDQTTTETTTEQTTTEQTTTYYEDDETTHEALGCAICAGMVGIPLVLYLIVSIVIAWWVYRDAKARAIPQGGIWAALGFLFNVLGLIIYLVVRSRPTTMPPAAPPPPGL